MTKKTHIAVGIAATINFIHISNILFLIIAVIGSFIPDVDYKLGLKHRGITHTLLALAITTGLFSLYSWKLGLLWGLNYSTHLLLDSLTITGIPLLFPLSKKCYGFKLICTGKSEDLFICLLALFFISYMYLL